jgi:hypothetical protein
MVDELDPELDAANQRQDAKDAARFRADAATLSEEAAHDRTKADELRRMGLATESDQMVKDAAGLAGRSADFTHRAELLDDALTHRKQGDADLAGVPEAHAQAEAARTKGDQLTDQAVLTFGDDVPTTIRLTAEAGAERGKEAALRELEAQLRTNAETEIVNTAVEEERQAREGLIYRAAPQPGIVDPFAPAPTSSLAPTAADEPVALTTDPAGEADPTDA